MPPVLLQYVPVCVCVILYFLSRCPKATAVAVYIYDLFPGTSTGLASHSRAPTGYVTVIYGILVSTMRKAFVLQLIPISSDFL